MCNANYLGEEEKKYIEQREWVEKAHIFPNK